MTFEDLWKIVRRYWVLILTASLVGLVLSTVYTFTREPKYSATSYAYVVADENSGGSFAGSAFAQSKAQAWLPLFKSNAVADRVIERSNLDITASDLANRTTATLQDESPAVSVTVTAASPEDAKSIADGIVDATSAEVQRLEGKTAGATIKVVSAAERPTRPSYPRPERILPLGLLAGMVIGFVLALIRRRQDTRIRTPEGLGELHTSPVLAVLPAISEREQESEHQSFQTREGLRQLRTNLRFIDVDRPPRTIVLTSARMGEGKSTVASSLAKVLAQSGESVILIDADLRRPRLAPIFDLDSALGLTQLLAGEVSVAEVTQPSGTPGLQVITAGQIPPNPSELLGSQRMSALLGELREDHFVILDAPPLLPVTDAALLSAHADGALLVVQADGTRQEQVIHAVKNVERVGGHVLGMVLNRVNTKRLRSIVYGEARYGYGAYGGYGSEYVADGEAALSSNQGVEDPTRDEDAPRTRREQRRSRIKRVSRR